MTAMAGLLFVYFVAPAGLDQVRAEANPERRSHLALEYALTAEKNAETSYSAGDPKMTAAALTEMLEAAELAQHSLSDSHKTPGRNPRQFKYAEQRSRELVKRLESLEHRMDFDDRKLIEGPKTKVQEIHDAWLEGIMSRQK